MWTFESFLYTIKIILEGLFMIGFMIIGFLLCGWVLSNGHWNPMEYTLIGRCIFIFWVYMVVKSTIEIQKKAIKDDEMEFEENSEEIE